MTTKDEEVAKAIKECKEAIRRMVKVAPDADVLLYAIREVLQELSYPVLPGLE